MSKLDVNAPGSGSIKDPLYVRETPNSGLFNTQFWVSKDAVVKIRQTLNYFSNGWVATNNSPYKIYIGAVENIISLKQNGTPIAPGGSFSSSSYVGELWIVADDSAVIGGVSQTCDVRVWEEML